MFYADEKIIALIKQRFPAILLGRVRAKIKNNR